MTRKEEEELERGFGEEYVAYKRAVPAVLILPPLPCSQGETTLKTEGFTSAFGRLGTSRK